MDKVIQRNITVMDASKKASVPWKLDEPYVQPWYAFSDGKWHAMGAGSSKPLPVSKTPNRLALFSWNIDFMLPFPNSRMQTALAELRRLTNGDSQRASIASVVLLQECLLSDLHIIQFDAWVRDNFIITDIDTSSWSSGYYGTTTLIDKRLSLRSCFRVHYAETTMERDALFVDLGIADRIVRICNTHLESLALQPPRRPSQMKVAASYMHQSSVHGSILSGDLNAIEDFDRRLHTDNELKDAYLELGGSDDSADGHTWGQQASTALRERFGTCRMDKVFYCGDLQLKSFEKFGEGVVVPDEAEQKEIVHLGFEKPWITDHLGVKAIFDFSDASSTP